MKCFLSLLPLLVLPLALASAQETAPAPPVASTSTVEANPDRKAIEGVLDKYVAAYEHQSMPQLVAIWPDLPHQKKDYKKIQQHFSESDIFIGSVEASIEPSDWQIDKDQAKVRCVRNEKYIKFWTASETIGADLRGPKAGYGQLPEPSQRTYQRKVTKNVPVMVTLHRSGDAWTISSVEEEKPH